jgi:hypothetical protein
LFNYCNYFRIIDKLFLYVNPALVTNNSCDICWHLCFINYCYTLLPYWLRIYKVMIICCVFYLVPLNGNYYIISPVNQIACCGYWQLIIIIIVILVYKLLCGRVYSWWSILTITLYNYLFSHHGMRQILCVLSSFLLRSRMGGSPASWLSILLPINTLECLFGGYVWTKTINKLSIMSIANTVDYMSYSSAQISIPK